MLLSQATGSVSSGNMSAIDELASKRAKLHVTILLPLETKTVARGNANHFLCLNFVTKAPPRLTQLIIEVLASTGLNYPIICMNWIVFYDYIIRDPLVKNSIQLATTVVALVRLQHGRISVFRISFHLVLQFFQSVFLTCNFSHWIYWNIV